MSTRSATAAQPTMAPPTVPAVIAGFATEIEVHDLGPYSIRLVSVRDLERHVDRERLLRDDETMPPYWVLAWSGSRVLARHIAERIDCAGRSALDVGCGLGLVALAAARKGARVSAIDREVAAIEFLLASADTNRLAVEAMVGDIKQVTLGRRFDVVFCAELLYEAAEFGNLAEALLAAVSPGGTLWVADAQRIDTSGFYQALRERGFVVLEVCACEVREEATLVRVRLIALGREAETAKR